MASGQNEFGQNGTGKKMRLANMNWANVKLNGEKIQHRNETVYWDTIEKL